MRTLLNELTNLLDQRDSICKRINEIKDHLQSEDIISEYTNEANEKFNGKLNKLIFIKTSDNKYDVYIRGTVTSIRVDLDHDLVPFVAMTIEPNSVIVEVDRLHNCKFKITEYDTEKVIPGKLNKLEFISEQEYIDQIIKFVLRKS